MENIIFCGGCGSFISANEISAGKASKINNIYYCQKCSTGTQPTPTRPAAAPPTQARPTQARPVPMPPRQPAQAARPVAVPVQPRPNLVAPTARPPVPTTPASRPQPPVRAATPLSARQTVPEGQVQAAPPARPIARPAKVAAKPAPLTQNQKVAPAKLSQTSRFKPAPRPAAKEPSFDIDDAGIEESDALAPRRFGTQKTAKGGMKKIYLIAGGIIVAIVAGLLIISMSNAAKQKAEDERQATLKKYYEEIVGAERDYPGEPQKVIEQIKKRADQLKGTDYEKKIEELEANAKARIEIAEKIDALGIPVDTMEQIEKRLKDINALKNSPAINDSLESKLKNMLTQFTKQKNKLAEEEKKARAEQEEAEKKMYADFNAKIESLKSQKAWKEILRECDILLGRPNTLQYQEEADKIKEEAKAAMEEEQERSRKRKEWQVLNDDISKWERSGDSKSEVYVDEENKIILKNPNSSANRGSVTTITNNNDKENWKDFTLTIEFKVLGGSLDIFLRGGNQQVDVPGYGVVSVFSGIPIPFPRKFKSDWQKYTIELKGKKLTISGTDLSEPTTADVPEGAGGIGINVKGGDNIIVRELKVKMIE